MDGVPQAIRETSWSVIITVEECCGDVEPHCVLLIQTDSLDRRPPTRPARVYLKWQTEGDRENVMSQAIVNPDELRRFAQSLKKFNVGLAEQLTALASQLDGLSATWRDQENRRFAEEFARNLRSVQRFIETNDEYIPFLLRKAERIDDYLQQR